MKTALTLLISMLVLACSASAVHEKGQLGPYNISFDMNTTDNYLISADGPSNGAANGLRFTRYNLSITGESGLIFVVLTDYGIDVPANDDDNKNIVDGLLQIAGCSRPEEYKVTIDGHRGILERSQSCNISPPALVTCVSYSPDAAIKSNVYRGRINCRIVSTYPWQTTRDMLNTIHIEIGQDYL